MKLAVNKNCRGVREFNLYTQILCLTGTNNHPLPVNDTKAKRIQI